MPFSSLHTVEQQLICQMLDCRSILYIARCSSTTLAAASSDFAFRFAVPIELCSLQLPNEPPSSLLRFAPVRLVWVSPSPDAFVAHRQEDRADVDRVCACPKLVGIDARYRQLDWPVVLSHECFRGLRELRLGRSAYAGDLTAAIGSMEQLSILSLEKTDRIDFGSLFSAIGELPQLTDLTLSWPRQDHPHGCSLTEQDARPLRECVHLRRLTLKFTNSDALDWILNDGMTELAEVTVIGFSLSVGLAPDGWAHALNSLPALSTLAILAAQDLDLALDTLRRVLAPDGPLRVLSVQPTPDQDGNLDCAAVLAMLESHPLLKCINLELWSVVEVSPRANGEDAVSQTQVRDEAIQCTWKGAQEYDLTRMRRMYEDMGATDPRADEAEPAETDEEQRMSRLRIVEEVTPDPHLVSEALRARFLKPASKPSTNAETKKKAR